MVVVLEVLLILPVVQELQILVVVVAAPELILELVLTFTLKAETVVLELSS